MSANVGVIRLDYLTNHHTSEWLSASLWFWVTK
jgi:hypothetical protein